jgi:class 3 adenylate cyclase
VGTYRTVLFADVRGSTGLTEQLGDVESRRLIGALMAELEATTRTHDGSVVKTIGDEIMAVFEDPGAAAAAAIQMQRDLRDRATEGGISPQIGIGLNAGPVVMDDGDVFGDVVIVAARLVSNAVATQILTTDETLQAMGAAEIVSRSLGDHEMKGREEPVHMSEILWRGETAQMTMLGPRLAEGPRSSLTLTLGTEVVRVHSDAMQPIELGRSEECTLVVPATSASRKHAKITARGGRFHLVDHSTNGTYVLQANGSEIVLHRDESVLLGAGHIRLGDPLTQPGPLDIAFEVTGGG